MFSLLLLAIHAPHPLWGQVEATAAPYLSRPRLEPAATPGANTALNTPWSPLAPASYISGATGAAAGRILSVAVDAADATGNTVYLGTTGGVWRSTNAAAAPGAVSFAPVTDQIPVLHGFGATASVVSVGSVSVQPGGTGVILAGTGDPTNRTDSIYGTGLLRSADGGQSWTVIAASLDPGTGQRSFFGEAFSGFAWSTVAPGLVVAAVSSAGGASAVNAGYSQQSEMGLYYSQDAGQSWQLATITDGPGREIQGPDIGIVPGAPAVSLVWNPVRHLFLAALRAHGFYASPDGITWTRLANQPGRTLTTNNCPALSGGDGSPNCPLYQAALAVQPATGDTFALFTSQSNGDGGLWQDVCGFHGSGCSTPAPSFLSPIPDTAFDTSSGVIAGAGHALSLQAVPQAGDTVLLAGTADLFRCSLAAGCAWRNTTNANGCAVARVGAAQHQAAWMPGTGTLYLATDHGLWRSTDLVDQQQPACSPDDATHFQNLNGSLAAIAEITSLAPDAADANNLLVGEGALGTAGGSDGAWQALLTSLGGQTEIGTGASAGTWFATSGAGVSISACNLGAACGPAGFGTQPIIGNAQVQGDGTSLQQPAVWMLDPQDASRMIVGTCRVWRGPASGLNWAPSNALSGMLDNQPAPFCQAGNTQIRSLAATGLLSGLEGASERVFAGLAGFPDGAQASAGHIYGTTVTPASTAASTTWHDLTRNPLTNPSADGGGFNPGAIAISSIAVDATDATGSTVYVGLSGFAGDGFAESANVSQVYTSSDAGQHWTNITSNLPNAPVNAVLVDPLAPSIVYLATDLGVYVTTTVTQCADPAQGCWGLYGTGLPALKVTSLATASVNGLGQLRIGTWGRGVWQAELASAAIQQQSALAATITPGSLSFNAQPVGSVSAAQTVTVSNSGQSAVTLGVPESTTADFAVAANTCGSTLATGASCTLSIAFAPLATGARSGTLTLATNTNAGPLSVSLSGNGLQGGVIVLTPLRLDFGAVLLGQTSPAQDMTVANTGTAPATLQPLTISGPFRIGGNSCTATLAPASSCTVAVIFAPQLSGAASGTLVVNDSSGTQTALLSGTGQTGPSDALSTVALSFAPQQLGTTSAPQQVVLTNSGDTTLNGIAAHITGDFTLQNQCGSSLAGHSSCSLVVAYAPQALGAESGQLTVQDLLQQQTVALSGSGAAPPVAPPGSGGGVGIATVAPLQLNFGVEGVATTSSAQTVTLINSGATVLSGIAISTSAGFNLAANACTSALNPGASCSLGVVFAPQAPGPLNGTVQISAASLASPLTIPATGMGADFQLSVQGASTSTVVGGATATYQLLLTPAGASAGQIALSCSGAPPGRLCSANPATVILSGSGATATIALTIATSAESAGSGVPLKPGLDRGWTTVVLAALIPLLWDGRRAARVRRRLLRHSTAVIAVGVLCWGAVGCGLTIHGGASTPASAASASQGSYTVTVGATAPGLVRTVTLNLIVE